MQSVSSLFSPYPDARKVEAAIEFKLIDPDASSNATITTSTSCAVSQTGQILDDEREISERYVALELNHTLLDGQSVSIPDEVNGIKTGWWSEKLSNENTAFTNQPYIEFTLSEPASSIGFTVKFDDKGQHFAQEFSVETYDENGGTITTKTITGNDKTECKVDMPSDNYSKVRFTFIKTALPYMRIVVSEFLFGIEQKFDKDNLVKATWTYETNMQSANLAFSTLVFTFDNTDKKYNLTNPNGIFQYLQNTQEITSELKIGENGKTLETVNMGKMFYSTSEASDDAITAEITATDAINWMDQSICSVYIQQAATVPNAIQAVLDDAGIDLTVQMDEEVAARMVGQWFPENSTHRECLRLIAQAARCAMYISREGVLTLENLEVLNTPVDSLDGDNLYNYNGLKVEERVNTLCLQSKKFLSGEETNVDTTATNKMQDEITKTVTVTNNIVYPDDAQNVANWLLKCYQRNMIFQHRWRGNPAMELGDTVAIYDAFGSENMANVTKITLEYNGGLTGEITAIKGVSE